MMSMADGGGSAAGQQVLHDLMIIKWCDVAFGVNNHRGFDVGLISLEDYIVFINTLFFNNNLLWEYV